MKPYNLLVKPQEQIQYLQTMKWFKNYYKYTNARRHDTRHGRAEHTARTHTHTHTHTHTPPSGGTRKERKKETQMPTYSRLQGTSPPAHSSLGGSPEKCTKKSQSNYALPNPANSFKPPGRNVALVENISEHKLRSLNAP